MQKKKIGIFTGYYLPHMGGVERYTEKLSAALIDLGYEIVIVTSNDSNLATYEHFDNLSIYRLHIAKFASQRYPIPLRSKNREILEKIESENIDYYIIQTRFFQTSQIGAKLGKRLGKPVMLVEHGTDHLSIGNKLLDFVGAIYEHALTVNIKRFVDKFYGVSEACNIWLRHFKITASGVWYNAVDKRDRLGVKDAYLKRYPSGTLVITYAGRLIKEKGILNLLDAYSKIKLDHPNQKMKLVVAGGGNLLDHIKSNYQDEDIDILGKLPFDDVMALFKRTDIFVHPSLYPEGLPTSLLEAGLMGCAVVATPKGGTEEVITDNENGMITDGSVDGLRQSITWLISHPEKRKSFADSLRLRVETNFDWSVVAQKVDKTIKEFGS